MSARNHGGVGDRYYARLAAAYVRGLESTCAPVSNSDVDLVEVALDRGVDLSPFKRANVLPRVRRVLGALHTLRPASLLDVGSGRGAFLWPLLDTFPTLPVLAIDTDTRRVSTLAAVSDGGIQQLDSRQSDVTNLDVADRSFDGVTILEVLEHLTDPSRAAREVVRVAQRFVIASVPSRPDDNPQHVTLFTAQSLTALFMSAGASRVNIDYVHNHMIATVRVSHS